jgi:hypothetical protein
VQQPRIRRIAFIGSGATGRSVQRDAADAGVKDVSAEPGGKNAMIVFGDADPAAPAAGGGGRDESRHHGRSVLRLCQQAAYPRITRRCATAMRKHVDYI